MDIFYVVCRKIYNWEIVDIKQFSDRLFVLCVEKAKLPYLFNMESANLTDNEAKILDLREKIRTCVNQIVENGSLSNKDTDVAYLIILFEKLSECINLKDEE